jgi:hypothetical protein
MTATAIKGPYVGGGFKLLYGPKVLTMTVFPNREKQAIIRSTGRDQYAEFIFSPDRDSKHIEIAL